MNLGQAHRVPVVGIAYIRARRLDHKPAILALANLARPGLHVAVRPALLRVARAGVVPALGEAHGVPAVAPAYAVAEARDGEAPVGGAHPDAARPALPVAPDVVARVLVAAVVPARVLARHAVTAVRAAHAPPGAVRDGLPGLLAVAVHDVACGARRLAPPVAGLVAGGAGHGVGGQTQADTQRGRCKGEFHSHACVEK
ncbi:hypothetical protein IF1G_10380 [Cordyceps javanica]|uniref:Uncharacterized protein n=1 Tax=Cordyceps javanica TaxID=43265 RepID=A0A545UN15_9HYPO|nr:hypothetical protein IF1G_10380 [Cordyceps javanica]TQW02611.1 hypothetical protein IF2G_09778 [Cordyceps javanica]